MKIRFELLHGHVTVTVLTESTNHAFVMQCLHSDGGEGHRRSVRNSLSEPVQEHPIGSGKGAFNNKHCSSAAMTQFVHLWEVGKFVCGTAWAEAGEGYITFEAARDGWGNEDCTVQSTSHSLMGELFNKVVWLPCEPPAGRLLVSPGMLGTVKEMTLSGSSELVKAASAKTVISIPEGVRIYGPHAKKIVSSAFGVVVEVSGRDGKTIGRNAMAVQLMDDKEEWDVGRDIGPTRPITLVLLYALVLWLSTTIPAREIQWLLGVVVFRFTGVTTRRPAQLRRLRNLRAESGVLTLSKNEYGWVEGIRYVAGAATVAVLVYEQHFAEQVILWSVSITSALVDLVTTKVVSDTAYWKSCLAVILFGVFALLGCWLLLPMFYITPIAQVVAFVFAFGLVIASKRVTSEESKNRLNLYTGMFGCVWTAGLICEGIYLWDGYWSYSPFTFYEHLKEPELSILYCSLAACGLGVVSTVAVVAAYLLVATSSPRVGHHVSAFKERKTANGFGHFKESGYSSSHVVAYDPTRSGGVVHTAQLTAPVSSVSRLPVFGWWGRAKEAA